MTNGFKTGFTTLEKEVKLDALPITGQMPNWLTGTLVRNGPAQFEVGDRSFNHWFDGFAMLHKFSFEEGNVRYANKYLQSNGYKLAQEKGKIMASEFGTDPCRSLFQRAAALFSSQPSNNTNVNLSRVADKFIAMTETPLPVEFDLETLETMGLVEWKDELGFGSSTAHPHYHFGRKAAINQIVMFGRETTYTVYEIPDGQLERQVLGEIPVTKPGYLHSFGLTENYAIIVEFPLVVNPLKLALANKPFIENYVWEPEQGARFLVMRLADGTIAGEFKSEAFFAFHHINAYETDGEIVVDISAYEDATLVNDLYLSKLRGESGGELSFPEFRRYRLNFDNETAAYDVLSDESIELPRINYRLHNGRDYTFAYGASTSGGDGRDFLNQLVKINVKTRETQIWFREDCYPGEPVFVAAPGAEGEDEGVILSVVLDGRRGTSFLLVLDAKTFDELARAEVPHHVPFGFHGQYFNN